MVELYLSMRGFLTMLADKKPEFGVVPEGAVIRGRMAQMWFVSALGKGGGQLIQMLALAVLARLLVPSDFGMVAMVMAVIGIAGVFSDMGLSAATIRARSLNEGQASSLLILNFCFGFATSVVLFFVAPLLMHIYQDQRAVDLAKVLSWSFFLSSLGTQHLALLRRQLKFALLAKINLAAIAVGQFSAILMALNGWAFWSIAVGMLVSTVIKVILAWIFNRWRPGRPEWSKALRSMVGFGGYLVVFSLLGYATLNAHNVVIGAEFGAKEVGFYSRAFAIFMLLMGYVTGPMDTVAPAALARMTDDPEAYKMTYLQTLSMMLLLTSPIGFVCAISAPDIIHLLLGDQWIRSVVILQILGLAAIPQTLCNSSGWLYQSHGDSRSMMQWGVGGWGTLIVLLTVGVQYGIFGVAIAYSGGMLLLVYPCMVLAFRRTTINFMEVVRRSAPIVLAAFLAALTMYGAQSLIPNWPPSLRLPVLLVVYGVSYLGCLLGLRQGDLLANIHGQLFRRRQIRGVLQ